MRILVASDLSAASDAAVRQGLALAKQAGHQLALCHVLADSPIHALFPQEYEADVRAQLALQPRLADALRAQAAKLVPEPRPDFEVFIEQGSDYAGIVARAESWRAELVVVGSHGRTGLSRILLGSVAERVVRYAPCAVLVARGPSEGVVLVATDLSEPSLPSIEAGAREAARRQRKLVVVHVMAGASQPGDAALALLGAVSPADPPDVTQARRSLASQIISDALTRFGATGEVLIAAGDPVDEIARLARSLPAELLVIGTKGHSAVARVLLGSIAADLVQNAPCSVLALRVTS